CARSYREHMSEYADMRALEVWYETLDLDRVFSLIGEKFARASLQKRVHREETLTVKEHDFPVLAEVKGSKFVIKDNQPLIYHHQLLNVADHKDNLQGAMIEYSRTLRDDRKVLFDRYQLIDVALKVVGVGSVGTFCAVALLMAADEDPLFLQIKEAGSSV